MKKWLPSGFLIAATIGFITEFTLISSFKVFSQNIPAHFEQITTNEGLSNNFISSLFQDHLGFIWIGTADGLNRYDGQEVQRYFHSFSDSNSLTGNYIYHIAEINGRYLFISTDNNLSIFNLQTNSFENYLLHLDSSSQYQEHRVFHVFQDRSKNIYIAFDAKIIIYDSTFRYKYCLTDLAGGNNLRGFESNITFYQDHSGSIWISSVNRGLYLFDPMRKTIIYKNNNPDHRPIFNYKPTSFYYDENDQQIYFAIWDSPLYEYSFRDNKISEIYFQNRENASAENVGNIRELVPDGNGNLWCGTSGVECLWRLHMDDWSSQHFTADAGNSYSLSSINTFSLLLDKNKNLWVGTMNGLNRLSLENSLFYSYESEISSFCKSKNYSIHMAFPDEEGNLWISTWGNYIICLKKSGQWKEYNLNPKDTTEESKYNWNFFRSHDGTLYITSDVGVRIYNATFDRFEYPKNYPDSLKDVKTIFGFEDSYHDLWFSLHGSLGLVHYKSSSKQWELFRNSLPPPDYLPVATVNKITEDHSDNLWMSCSGRDEGLVKWTRRTDEFIVYGKNGNTSLNPLGKNISDMIIDEQNVAWLASNYGLIRFDITSETWRTYTRENGMPDDNAASIAEDKNGIIWIALYNGIVRFNKLNEQINTYGLSYGLPRGAYSEFNFYDSVRNEIYFCIDKSVIRFNPDSVKVPDAESPVYISEARAGNMNLLTQRHGTIELPYSSNTLNFSFTSINFRDGRNTQYAYKLNGLDKNWNFSFTRRTATYGGLRPGHYTFQVKAENPTGIWNKVPASVSLTITAPFWQTWWFYTLCALAVIAILYGLYRVRINKVLAVQHVRTQISRDLHDEVGSTLSSINIISNAAVYVSKNDPKKMEEYFTKISSTSQRMMDVMSDIIWSINPKNDKMENMSIRMREHASEMLEPIGIIYSLETDENILMIPLPLDWRRDFYLIYKEAINNAAKYSGGTQVSISLQYNDHTLVMKIIDNGIGFNTGEIQSGNGIRNMTERAQNIRGQILISSQPGHGTSIILKLPVT